ncbi:hypothetical protein QLH51_18680 [Sphingomonas sp. 2R-10]|uniref:hypothetical protein n=1 Tax=Sphingomonas sp. 2R-10 TaxID=3045148 RepID=UPI000F773F5E|nr:hypothetical protein [Sphingomonas sp. 2R-10]MDJ0278822.1 hypothetical protein [Sphingomonas sp. 2R-10]
MADSNLEALAKALEKIASEMESNPAPVIGEQIIMTGNPGSGPMIGKSIIIDNVSGNSGSVVGQSIVIDASTSAAETQLVAELREAAASVRGGNAPKTWVGGLIKRAGDFAGKTISGATVAAAGELAKTAFT